MGPMKEIWNSLISHLQRLHTFVCVSLLFWLDLWLHPRVEIGGTYLTEVKVIVLVFVLFTSSIISLLLPLVVWRDEEKTAVMALPFNPACFFSFLLPLMAAFYFVHGEAELLSNCTKAFSCGNLGFVEFPFAKHTQPHCGLVAVNCDTTPPTVQLGTGGDWYQLQRGLNFGGDYSIFLGDSKLQKPFGSHNYSNLNYTIHFQNSPSITFLNWDASLLNTYFKCNDSQADDIGNYESYNCCDGISLYYKRHQLPENDLKCDTVNCTLYPSPFIIQHTNDGLTAQFVLRMEVSKTCQGGGQCTKDSKNDFRCAAQVTTGNTPTGNTSKRKPIPIIVSGALALIVVSMAIFLVWQCKEGRKGGYSRNTSSDSTSDLERGHSRLFGILVFSYSELEEATTSFHPSKELGDGAFGTVYFGILGDGREVAVKRLHERSCKRMEQFANEISILTRLKHQNLVTLYGCSSRHNRELLLVYEYIPNGTLADHLHGKRAADRLLTWPIRMKIAVETAAALVYLHASDIIHRDVKTSNILLDKNFCVKVADFGHSRLFPPNVTHATTTPQGTPGYVDPDYHECYQLTYKSDVYSFGVVLIELVSSMPAVDTSRHTHEIYLAKLAMNKIITGAFDELIDSSLEYEKDTEINRMTTSVAALAFQCLQPDKDMRPTMEHVLESLKEIQGNELRNDDERVNGEETNVSKEEEVRRKAMRWTWGGPSLAADGVILKHVAATKSSS